MYLTEKDHEYGSKMMSKGIMEILKKASYIHLLGTCLILQRMEFVSFTPWEMSITCNIQAYEARHHVYLQNSGIHLYLDIATWLRRERSQHKEIIWGDLI